MTELEEMDERIRQTEAELIELRRRRVAIAPITADDKLLLDFATAYINTHYARNIDLRDVAEVIRISPSRLSTILNTGTGSGFRDTLNTARLAEATRLMMTTTMQVKAIAYAVGYSDAHYFSKVFHARIGVKASDYRRMKAAA